MSADKCRLHTDNSGRRGSEGKMKPITKALNYRMEVAFYFLNNRAVFAGQSNTLTSLFLENNSRDGTKDGFRR